MDDPIRRNREFMKGFPVADYSDPQNDFHSSDQQKGIAPPPLQKEYDSTDAKVISLPPYDENILVEPNILALIRERRSRRRFADIPLSANELSYLLWATQGVLKTQGERIWTRRTVPSAGARHPYETYLIIRQIDGIDRGVYRYLALTHQLLFLFDRASIRDELFAASYGEHFVTEAPVCFIWSCIPYRGEWRYNTMAHKSMLLDAGHICQNLYLAAESIGCGTCAVAGYHQQGIDQLLGLDGVEEYVVYLAPVGKRQ